MTKSGLIVRRLGLMSRRAVLCGVVGSEKFLRGLLKQYWRDPVLYGEISDSLHINTEAKRFLEKEIREAERDLQV